MPECRLGWRLLNCTYSVQPPEGAPGPLLKTFPEKFPKLSQAFRSWAGSAGLQTLGVQEEGLYCGQGDTTKADTHAGRSSLQ